MMPNREQRRHADKQALGKWVHVEDANGNPFDIYFRDISGKDEWDYLQQVQNNPNAGQLTDLFFKGQPTLINIAALIWCARRRYEKKLLVMDVLPTVNLMTIETLEMHDPDDPDEQESEQEAVQSNGSGQGSPGFGPTPSNSGATSVPSSPGSVPSTA